MQKKFLLEFVKRDLTERYVGSILGIWWSFLWPLVNIFIYMVIFSKVMGAKIRFLPYAYSYGLYLASGLIAWTAFSNTVLRSTTVLLEKKHILTKISLPLWFFPLSIALSESVTFFISLFIYFCVLFLMKIPLSFSVLLVPIAYLMQFIFAYSLGLFLSILNVFLRDIKEVVNILMQFWFWFTPIVYVVQILPEKVCFFIELNPVYAFIQVYQKVFVTKEPIKFTLFFFWMAFCLLFFFFSHYFCRKLEKDVRDFL